MLNINYENISINLFWINFEAFYSVVNYLDWLPQHKTKQKKETTGKRREVEKKMLMFKFSFIVCR